MNRYYTLFIFILLCVFFCPCYLRAEEIGVVAMASGPVEIWRKGSTGPVEAKASDTLYEGDRIKTGAVGRADIILRDESCFIIGENTDLELTRFLFQEDKKNRILSLELFLGEVEAIVTRLFGGESKAEIYTRAAIAGVKGTSFVVRALADSTNVYVLEGEVLVRNRDDSIPGVITLMRDQWTRVTMDSPPLHPQPIPGDIKAGIFKTMSPGPQPGKGAHPPKGRLPLAGARKPIFRKGPIPFFLAHRHFLTRRARNTQTTITGDEFLFLPLPRFPGPRAPGFLARQLTPGGSGQAGRPSPQGIRGN